jgi:hypothetical protein
VLEQAFHARGVPLRVLAVDNDEARVLYRARLVALVDRITAKERQ